LTCAAFLQDAQRPTPVFVRFSTVAGGAGSVDLPRDVRGFAVKFYTKEGNWDLVGNNMPVFFIQDPIKFPDMVHAFKQEPDRGFPQAATAHDNAWDFVSLTPESMHMVMWAMSDRAIPRSYRFMEGFGVHTFRLVTAEGKSTFVKFHWKPKLGLQSVVWDEAVKINGADPDYHRRDLWNAIKSGDYPEWELGLQLFDEEFAEKFEFDILDPTKLIPEEQVPIRIVGRLVLDRCVDNFFQETEQVAFCTQNVTPGIDFTNDPLLQGRNFSYLDTQLKRLGSVNFTQLPINAAKALVSNFQRDGHMNFRSSKGRVNYEPNSYGKDGGPRESPKKGFRSYPEEMSGKKVRQRSETYADHYSQARLFFLSQTEYEQAHMASALVFELSKVETPHVRRAMVAHLRHIDESLATRVAEGLGLEGLPDAPPLAAPIVAYEPSKPLRVIGNGEPTLRGQVVGVLVNDGSDGAVVTALRDAVERAGGMTKIVAPWIGGVTLGDGKRLAADGQIAGSPSVVFDSVALILTEKGAEALVNDAAAVDFVRDAYGHLKAIAYDDGATPLLVAANVRMDEAVVRVEDPEAFVEAAKTRLWSRESSVRRLA